LPAQRFELIRRLAAAGLRWIEVASLASPKWVPQMAGAEEVLRQSVAIPDIRPIVLVLNDRGYERAVNAGARYTRLVVASTETMNQKNANASPEQTMASYKQSSSAPVLTALNWPAQSRPHSAARLKEQSIQTRS
jgi:hydroxymethylglutaryl-CoA lyase